MHANFYATLIDSNTLISLRYQAIFELKNIGSLDAITALMNAYPFCGDSVLLKHELLYTLGQLPEDKYPFIRDFLVAKMDDAAENSLSRHEAA